MSREIFDNPIWSDPLKFRLFFFIVGNAVFSDDGVNYGGIQVKRGQFLRSLRNLQDDLTYREGRGNAIKKPPLETLRRKIKELEKEGRITAKSTEYGTLFTVVNYDKYQGFEHYQNSQMRQQWDSNETAMRQRWDNNNNVNNDLYTTTATTETPVQLFEKLLCRLSPSQMDRLYQWQDDFGGQAEIINEAIKIADDKNKRYFGFVEFLLREWANNNLTSLERVRAYEQEKFRKESRHDKKISQYGGGSGRPATKTLEQVLREADEAKRVWGG